MSPSQLAPAPCARSSAKSWQVLSLLRPAILCNMLDCGCAENAERIERSTLGALLVINGVMFLVEALAGWWSESTGLLADSLDMCADAFVYGLALLAVGRSTKMQARAAAASGWLQVSLGAGVLIEVARRLAFGSEPISAVMIGVGMVALAANLTCLALLAKHRTGGVHMRASWIFSTNDVIANIGVISSGFLVMYLDSYIPDLIVGTLVSSLVVWGGIRILSDVRDQKAEPPTDLQEH
jgi:Co/Zn/Cd efflux system component